MTAKDMTLLAALMMGLHDTAHQIIHDGIDVNKPLDGSWAPLFWARDTKSIGLLVEAGADTNVRDDKGRTPLHVAGSSAIGEALIRVGADVNAADSGGETPLHVAAIRGQDELVCVSNAS